MEYCKKFEENIGTPGCPMRDTWPSLLPTAICAVDYKNGIDNPGKNLLNTYQ